MGTPSLNCGMWGLVPWPGNKLRLPALGAQSLSRWTTREVLESRTIWLRVNALVSGAFLGRKGESISAIWEGDETIMIVLSQACVCVCVCACVSVCLLVTQSCQTLCDPMDCSPPGSSVHRIFQARILEWVAIPFSEGVSWPRDQTRVSCTAGRFFTPWATEEAR